MNEIQLTRTVNAPAPVSWDVLTDIDHWTEVLTGITRVERLDEGSGFGLGTRWRETRTMYGREATEEMVVTAFDPPSRYVVEADSHGAAYRSEIRVEPDGTDVSTIRMTFAATPRGAVNRLLAATVARAFQGATRKALQADLDDIAAAAEARR